MASMASPIINNMYKRASKTSQTIKHLNENNALYCEHGMSICNECDAFRWYDAEKRLSDTHTGQWYCLSWWLKKDIFREDILNKIQVAFCPHTLKHCTTCNVCVEYDDGNYRWAHLPDIATDNKQIAPTIRMIDRMLNYCQDKFSWKPEFKVDGRYVYFNFKCVDSVLHSVSAIDDIVNPNFNSNEWYKSLLTKRMVDKWEVERGSKSISQDVKEAQRFIDNTMKELDAFVHSFSQFCGYKKGSDNKGGMPLGQMLFVAGHERTITGFDYSNYPKNNRFYYTLKQRGNNDYYFATYELPVTKTK